MSKTSQHPQKGDCARITQPGIYDDEICLVTGSGHGVHGNLFKILVRGCTVYINRFWLVKENAQ